MALNIKDPETERLAGEVAGLAGESKTAAIRVALRERKARLLLAGGSASRGARAMALLEGHVWPSLPPGIRGTTITKEEEEAILGFGDQGA
jgi:antitoxin VapB